MLVPQFAIVLSLAPLEHGYFIIGVFRAEPAFVVPLKKLLYRRVLVEDKGDFPDQLILDGALS